MHDESTSERRCVECRWCELRIDFDSGSHYFCGRERLPLDWDVHRREACSGYRAPVPCPFWGP